MSQFNLSTARKVIFPAVVMKNWTLMKSLSWFVPIFELHECFWWRRRKKQTKLGELSH